MAEAGEPDENVQEEKEENEEENDAQIVSMENIEEF